VKDFSDVRYRSCINSHGERLLAIAEFLGIHLLGACSVRRSLWVRGRGIMSAAVDGRHCSGHDADDDDDDDDQTLTHALTLYRCHASHSALTSSISESLSRQQRSCVEVNMAGVNV